MKGFFSDVLATVSEEKPTKQILKSYKAFVFRLRSNSHLLAPDGLSISEVDNIDWLKATAEQKINISGSLAV